MKRTVIFLSTLLACARGLAAVFAVPTSGEGNSFTTVPFGVFPADMPSLRYQQVYDGSRFIPQLPPEGAYLAGINFRVDGLGGRPFRDTLANVQINFSTTSRTDTDLSLVFAENVGPNDMIAVGPGPLTIGSSFSHMTSPQPWGDRIVLDTPFLYNPYMGNLLMDIRIFEGSGRFPLDAVYFDAFDLPRDSIARVWSDSVGDLMAGHSDTIGLPTLFHFEPVPEPSTLAMGCLAACLAAGGWWRTRKVRES